MLAIALVVGVIAIIGLVRGDSSTIGTAGSPVVSQVVTTARTSSPSATSTLTSPAPSTSLTPPPSTSAAPPPITTAPPAVAAPPPATTAVEVYNVSRRRGIAESAATRLHQIGYQITHVRNRIGYPLTTTTVFYDPGNATAQAAAEGVVSRNVGVVVAAPRPANVPESGTLIVYVASSYA